MMGMNPFMMVQPGQIPGQGGQMTPEQQHLYQQQIIYMQ